MIHSDVAFYGMGLGWMLVALGAAAFFIWRDWPGCAEDRALDLAERFHDEAG